MAGRAAHPKPLEAHPSPARARCARREGAGGARGARVPPAHARIPRWARGAGARALTAPLHAPYECGGRPLAEAQHAHARLRARRARRTGAGRRRGPWKSPLHPGSPREGRSPYLPPSVLAHFTPFTAKLAASPASSSSRSRARSCGPTGATGSCAPGRAGSARRAGAGRRGARATSPHGPRLTATAHRPAGASTRRPGLGLGLGSVCTDRGG